ncbi:hypothetical protein [Streptomyces sp. NPDC005125]
MLSVQSAGSVDIDFLSLEDGTLVTANRVRQLDTALAATVMHTLLTQNDNGSWSARPAPRTAETAIACFALAWSGDRDVHSKGAVARARSWLFSHPVRQTGSRLAYTVESALWSLAVDDGATVELGAVQSDPADEAHLVDLVQVLALYGDRPIDGGKTLQALRRSFQQAYGDGESDPLGNRGHAVSLAAASLLDMPLTEGQPSWQAIDRLISIQSVDGSFGEDVMAAGLAFLALGASAPDSDAWRRCRDHLMAAQQTDGTWLRGSTDVLDTALTLRAFRDNPAFDEHALPAAVAFLRSEQNTDGGWPARRGDASDTGVTALVLTSLTGLLLPDRIVTRAFGFLESRQTLEGLWSAGPWKAELPCEETVAHVVAALRRYPLAHSIRGERARSWLRELDVDMLIPALSRREGRFLGLPYATFRTADALGWSTPESQAAAGTLAHLQNPDGGWPCWPGGHSGPATTGLSLAVLEGAGVLTDNQWATGLDYLIGNLGDGRWKTGFDVATPRPLPSRSQTITQALAAAGLHAAQRHAHAKSPV